MMKGILDCGLGIPGVKCTFLCGAGLDWVHESGGRAVDDCGQRGGALRDAVTGDSGEGGPHTRLPDLA